MRSRRSFRLLLITVAVLLAANLVPAIADVLAPPAPDPLPKVAFVARNDNPADALAVGPVAGALGGVLATTPSTRLSDEAAATLTSFGPEVVYVAGGTAAITGETYEAIDSAGPWETRRLPGVNRDDTARLIATILEDLGVGRPLVTGGQVVGDAWLGGTLTAEQLLGELDVPPAPYTWSVRDDVLESASPTFPADPITVETLTVDVPADGTLSVRGSVLLADQTTVDGLANATAYLVLNPPDVITEAIFDDIFGAGEETLRRVDDLNQSTVLAIDGTVAVEAGPLTVGLVMAGSETLAYNLAQLTAVWMPGEAQGPGLEISP